MANVRIAVLEDAASISRVHVASWRSTYRGIVQDRVLDSLDAGALEARWRQQLQSDVPFWVAENDGEVLGFICGGLIREPVGDFDAELYAVYLLEKAQGKGLGRVLVGELALYLLGRGHRSMIVWALSANAAVTFYQHLGAALVSRKEIEIGDALLEEVAYGWARLNQLIPVASKK